MSHLRTKLAVAACGLAAAAFLGFLSTGFEPKFLGSEQPPPGAAPMAEKSVGDLVTQVSRSIARVAVLREFQVKDAKTGKVTQDYTGESGTGFVIRCDQTGGDDTTVNVEFDVVTNQHVLAIAPVKVDWTGPARLFCRIHGVTSTRVMLLGADAGADLAVIRVQGQASKDRVPRPLAWADPKTVRVGDRAVAIGYARNLEGKPSVTQGIISALNRSSLTTGPLQGTFGNLLQTDASINHGNSGGPLLNMRGEVMGVNSYTIPPAVAKDATGNVTVDPTVGINFARSSATARPFVEQIVKTGKVNRLDLGALIANTVPDELALYYNWPVGVRISSVPPKSPADNAGIKVGDIVVAIGSAAERPATPDASQETRLSVTGDFNDQLGLRQADASLWVRFIRPPDAFQMDLASGKLPLFPAGVATQLAFLR